ncbi:MAG: alginate lyase family protein [Bacteroidota bacterium]
MRHLQVRQLVYQFWYRFVWPLDRTGKSYPKVLPPTIVFSDGPTCGSTNLPSKIAPITLLGTAHFSLLNLTQDFGAISAIDWEYSERGKLWTYNLNYFEFLRQPGLELALGQNLIDGWMDQSNHLRQAWEPYPLSLRLVHWLSFYREQQTPVPQRVTRSLYRQYRTLWYKREFHLGGNHLLENAMALFLGAWYFQDGARLSKSRRFLQRQLSEQYLPDGAHYELSPMYHCVLLWRLLDVYALVFFDKAEQKLPVPLESFMPFLRDKLQRQLGWLKAMLNDQGYYPHFNDSTDGIAPTPIALLGYAKQMELKPLVPAHPFPYRKYYWGTSSLWVDVAPLGSPEQPGHAHADNLHFCLSDAERPIIIDTAVSTYEKNKQRLWERSTTAHNTVTIKGENSSEIWGGFRCGRRARTKITAEQSNELVAEHDGYRQLGKAHRRSFHWAEDTLQIEDYTLGKGTAHFHFHPSIEPARNAKNEIIVGPYLISYSPAAQGELQRYECAVGFNQLCPAWRLVLDFEGDLITQVRKI